MPAFLGGKWGESGARGAPGGVVTWSVVKPDIAGVRDTFSFTEGSNFTRAASAFAAFPTEPLLAEAFAMWSAVANIEFVRVPDDGARLGEGATGDIRIAFGEMDGGAGRLIGLAFGAPAGEFSSPVSGDILFDVDEFAGFRAFMTTPERFRLVALHEIGHAIGLDHVISPPAVMNPNAGNGVFIDLQPDDIQGARQLYGPQDRSFAELHVGDGPDLTVLDGPAGLRLVGDERDNRILGGAGREKLSGADGADLLSGRGGNDTVTGGAGADRLQGGGGNDLLRGGGDADRLAGGRDDDRLIGAGGDDRLVGGGGDDLLRGGGGADRFDFRGRFGDDVIADFDPAADRLDFRRAPGVDSLDDIAVTTRASGLLIETANGSVFLRGLGEAPPEEAFIF